MTPSRSLSRTAAAVVAVVMVCLLVPQAAQATPSVSGEVSGNSAAARTAVDALRTPWVSTLAADGYTAPTPMVLTAPVSSTVSGVIGTTAVGTTVSVERSRYSASRTAPVFVAASSNPGTAACTNNGLSVQGLAPRPASLVGNAACSNGNGTVYTESGGTGEGTTRDAVTFSFSRPVWGFGAWFGDLETRTDGQGVPAIVRLLERHGHRARGVPGRPGRQPVGLLERRPRAAATTRPGGSGSPACSPRAWWSSSVTRTPPGPRSTRAWASSAPTRSTRPPSSVWRSTPRRSDRSPRARSSTCRSASRTLGTCRCRR